MGGVRKLLVVISNVVSGNMMILSVVIGCDRFISKVSVEIM